MNRQNVYLKQYVKEPLKSMQFFDGCVGLTYRRQINKVSQAFWYTVLNDKISQDDKLIKTHSS